MKRDRDEKINRQRKQTNKIQTNLQQAKVLKDKQTE